MKSPNDVFVNIPVYLIYDEIKKIKDEKIVISLNNALSNVFNLKVIFNFLKEYKTCDISTIKLTTVITKAIPIDPYPRKSIGRITNGFKKVLNRSMSF